MIIGFMGVTSLLSSVFNITAVYTVAKNYNLLAGSISYSDVELALQIAFSSVLICTGLGMIPIVLGVKRKSIVLTIIASTIIIYFEETLSIQELLLLSILGVISIALTLWRLNSVDIKN
jgi:hypothetical protein